MENLFESRFNEWLWAEKKTFNPFLKALSESMKGWREVELPELIQSPKDAPDFYQENI